MSLKHYQGFFGKSFARIVILIFIKLTAKSTNSTLKQKHNDFKKKNTMLTEF